MMNIDTHFHIFDKKHISNEHARYSINYDAAMDEWEGLAKEQAISGGVIVQPSFLGFDNTILLNTIKCHSTSLKGVAAVDPGISQQELSDLKIQGIRGVRLNLFGDSDPLGTLEKNQALIRNLRDQDLHLQIHHDDGLLNQLLLHIPDGVKIVIDHFGRPLMNDEFTLKNEGINKHLGMLWVKLSAQYRTPKINHQYIYKYWLTTIGPEHLLWGSDWPHTRYESSQTYADQMQAFLRLTDDHEITGQILSENPRALYWP